jgi:esterase/lipase superfamily enzyme
MTQVYFATNRAADSAAPAGFGAQLAPAVSYGLATFDTHGKPAIGPVTAGGWSDDLVDQIVSAGKTVFVTIHGFDYAWPDALARARLLGDIYGQAGADATVLAFSWPSSGRLVDFPDLAGSYEHDQKQAAASAGAIALFLAQLSYLRFNIQARHGSARIVLLCHSMGNFAFAGALDALQDLGGAPLFDAVALAAADEQWDSFSLPGGGRLGRLGAISAQTSIYFARHDAALMISQSPIVNGVQRLGFDGPKGRANTTLFPADHFRLIDCTPVEPEDLNPDDSHQYYRTVPAVVADIAAVIAGSAKPVGTLLEKAS